MPGRKISSFSPALHHCISAGQQGLLDKLLVAGGNPLLPCDGKGILTVEAAVQMVADAEKALAAAAQEAATRGAEAAAAAAPKASATAAAATAVATPTAKAAAQILAQWKGQRRLDKANAAKLIEVRMPGASYAVTSFITIWLILVPARDHVYLLKCSDWLGM